MAKRRIEIGKTGQTVRANLKRIRTIQRMTLRDLSERLELTDRPLSINSINEIETGARRVDSDDLIVLAVALNCSPLALLLPPSSGEHVVDITGAGMYPGADVWAWAKGERPLIVNRLVKAAYPKIEEATERNRAARDQYRRNSDPQLQGIGDAPNIYLVEDSSEE